MKAIGMKTLRSKDGKTGRDTIRNKVLDEI
jgi:hypothetical protein